VCVRGVTGYHGTKEDFFSRLLFSVVSALENKLFLIASM
jgi:hypothetical protein